MRTARRPHIPLAPTGLPSFPDMSRAGRGEPRPPHDLVGAWSDTADPINRILSCPVSVPSARSRRARKERSETCKTNRHPAPAGRSSAGSTPTPTRTGCTSWTGGAARSCPAGSPPTRRDTRRSPGRSRRPGSRPASRWRETSSYGAGLTRHLASLGMPVREALSPARTQRRRPGQGEVRRVGRGEGRPRGDVRLEARDPQKPGRVGRRGALQSRRAPGR